MLLLLLLLHIVAVTTPCMWAQSMHIYTQHTYHEPKSGQPLHHPPLKAEQASSKNRQRQLLNLLCYAKHHCHYPNLYRHHRRIIWIESVESSLVVLVTAEHQKPCHAPIQTGWLSLQHYIWCLMIHSPKEPVNTVQTQRKHWEHVMFFFALGSSKRSCELVFAQAMFTPGATKPKASQRRLESAF